MISRRVLLPQLLWFLVGCAATRSPQPNVGKLVIGVIAYAEGTRSIDQYRDFITYLEGQAKTWIELEPAYNEIQALEQIERRAWSLVFASSGLAAIAASQAQYLPLFPLQEGNHLTSVLVTATSSSLQTLADLNGKRLALGQPGSATGYYVPLYDLYGTTLAEIRIAPTPQTLLQWIAEGEVDAGALSKVELERYQAAFPANAFRAIHTSRTIPPGAVLASPTIERNQLDVIQTVMNQASPALAESAGYIPNAAPPDYKTLSGFIEKVKPIEARIHETPAPLYQP